MVCEESIGPEMRAGVWAGAAALETKQSVQTMSENKPRCCGEANVPTFFAGPTHAQ
jgi:hypothetical protein